MMIDNNVPASAGSNKNRQGSLILFAILFGLTLLSGCAPTTYNVDLRYQPTKQLVPAVTDDLGGHFGARDDRHAGRHRFEQDQPLRFGARGKDENVGCGIAIGQRLLAVEVADELDGILQTQRRGLRLEVGHGRAFAGDHEQRIGADLASLNEGFEEEADVLFMGDAANEQGHRPRFGYAEFLAKALSIAAGELRHRDTGRQNMHRRGDAIAFKPLTHRRRWHDHRIELIALPA